MNDTDPPCGSVKVKGYQQIVGNLADDYLGQGWGKRGENFPVVDHSGKVEAAEFNGHARQESINEWISKGWRSADLLAAGYSEGKSSSFRTYEVPNGYVIKCVMREVGDKKIFNIITRPSAGKETKIHERWCVLSKKRY